MMAIHELVKFQMKEDKMGDELETK